MKVHFEKVTMREPLLVKEVKSKVFTAPFHFHPEIELCLIVKGSGKRFVGDSIEDFQRGDLVLLGENLPHFWSDGNKPSTDGEINAHAIVVQFNTLFLGENFLDLSGAKHIETLIKNSSHRGICITGKTKDIVTDKIFTMQQKQTNTFGRVLALLDILDILATSPNYYFLASPGFKSYFNPDDCQKVNKIYDYVYKNINNPLDIAKVAELVNMSVSAFCHFFKKRTQKTFTQFVNETRIGKARRLLIESDRSISEIGFECGYNSISNFNKQFDSLTGIAPKNFRKSYYS